MHYFFKKWKLQYLYANITDYRDNVFGNIPNMANITFLQNEASCKKKQCKGAGFNKETNDTQQANKLQVKESSKIRNIEIGRGFCKGFLG